MIKRILITAGPTREMLDPVRFLSNLSTGEMGYALAREAKSKKYHVHDEKSTAKVGDKVSFVACKPISKNKKWKIVEPKKATKTKTKTKKKS